MKKATRRGRQNHRKLFYITRSYLNKEGQPSQNSIGFEKIERSMRKKKGGDAKHGGTDQLNFGRKY